MKRKQQEQQSIWAALYSILPKNKVLPEEKTSADWTERTHNLLCAK